MHLEGDLVRLKAYYQRQGFYHTEIVPKIETTDNRVKVELHITEGPYVQVVHEEVTIAPTTPPLDLSALQRQWPLKPGDRFTVDGYEALKRLYLDYLLDHGHPRAQAEGKVYLDEAEKYRQDRSHHQARAPSTISGTSRSAARKRPPAIWSGGS